MWVTVIVSATEWANFFTLRCHEDAQPEFQKVALMVAETLAGSTPRPVGIGEWHLPYIQQDERAGLPLEVQQQCSVARCARVSYLTHEGKRDVEKDKELYDRLLHGQRSWSLVAVRARGHAQCDGRRGSAGGKFPRVASVPGRCFRTSVTRNGRPGMGSARPANDILQARILPRLDGMGFSGGEFAWSADESPHVGPPRPARLAPTCGLSSALQATPSPPVVVRSLACSRGRDLFEDLQTMPTAALIDDNLLFSSQISAKLAQLGLAPVVLGSADGAVGAAGREPPVVILVNLASDRLGPLDLVRAIKAQSVRLEERRCWATPGTRSRRGSRRVARRAATEWWRTPPITGDLRALLARWLP